MKAQKQQKWKKDIAIQNLNGKAQQIKGLPMYSFINGVPVLQNKINEIISDIRLSINPSLQTQDFLQGEHYSFLFGSKNSYTNLYEKKMKPKRVKGTLPSDVYLHHGNKKQKNFKQKKNSATIISIPKGHC